MDAFGTVSPEQRVNITEQGRHDLLCAALCQCNPRLAGLIIQCPDCGTVYGSVADTSLARRQPWTRTNYASR